MKVKNPQKVGIPFLENQKPGHLIIFWCGWGIEDKTLTHPQRKRRVICYYFYYYYHHHLLYAGYLYLYS
jgi:hypothetical protein